MARVMYFDCFAGAAGDMVLGALLDAGLPLDALQQALGSLGVGHALRTTKVLRAGITATHVDLVAGPGHDDRHQHTDDHDDHTHQRADHHHEHEHDHEPGQREPKRRRRDREADVRDAHQTTGHSHDHHHAGHTQPHSHGHRSLAEITHLIGQSALSAAGRERAVRLFRRIGEAEAAIHDMSIDEVHLHEVGAVDSIIDIVGAVFAFEWFGIDDIVASPMNVGAGTVEIAHGVFPVPAPATIRLLAGVPVYSTGIQAELVTPTGALLVSSYARAYGPLPAMTVDRIGYGAGTRDLGKVPNVLRVVIGERAEASVAPARAEAIVQLQCEIDDMSPQLFGPVSDQLFAAGALDVFLTAAQMKKGRPGTLLTVLAPPHKRETICDLVFRETTTLGVRFQDVWRETLDRKWVEVAVTGGTIRMKVAMRRGQVVNAAPEFDDCVRVANATGRPVKIVQAEAMRAYMEK
ncbi:MAG TPA: nickel pincer cofactor biosynthesis protein LarC [Vicinamibacterales bacterium]|nr:nickel pincer cofactor biosynthesis protein LarC [Vicinamibacterales bacterium]